MQRERTMSCCSFVSVAFAVNKQIRPIPASTVANHLVIRTPIESSWIPINDEAITGTIKKANPKANDIIAVITKNTFSFIEFPPLNYICL